MLTRKAFARGFEIILAVFGRLEVTKEKLDIWYDLLNDIEDNQFEDAVKKICREVRDIYPGTNIVALIRAQINEDDGIQVIR